MPKTSNYTLPECSTNCLAHEFFLPLCGTSAEPQNPQRTHVQESAVAGERCIVSMLKCMCLHCQCVRVVWGVRCVWGVCEVCAIVCVWQDWPCIWVWTCYWGGLWSHPCWWEPWVHPSPGTHSTTTFTLFTSQTHPPQTCSMQVLPRFLQFVLGIVYILFI